MTEQIEKRVDAISEYKKLKDRLTLTEQEQKIMQCPKALKIERMRLDIKNLMREKRFGFYEMAVEMGISHSTLYKFLNVPEHKFNMDSLFKISDYLKAQHKEADLTVKALELADYKKAYEQEFYHNTLMRKLLSEIKTACRIQSYNLIPYGAKELQTLILGLIEQAEV